MVSLLATSLQTPAPARDRAFEPTCTFTNYAARSAQYWPQLLRSFVFALIATVLALPIGYPMAYLIAVRRAPGCRGILLVLIIAPFFSSFILRTQAWKQILADEGPSVVRAPHVSRSLPGRTAGSPPPRLRRGRGLTYNFLPFMALPIYANLERLDTAAASRPAGTSTPARSRPSGR